MFLYNWLTFGILCDFSVAEVFRKAVRKTILFYFVPIRNVWVSLLNLRPKVIFLGLIFSTTP